LKSIKKLFLLLVLIGLAAAAVYYFRDTQGPLLTLTPSTGPISGKTPLLLTLSDEGMGLKQVQVTVLQAGNRLPLASQDFPPKTTETRLELNLGALKLNEGEIQIEAVATDQAIYHLGKGNSSLQLFELTYDTHPPIISILSKAHNFSKGGSGLVTYRLNEDVDKTGVLVGDVFFPGFKQESGIYACLLAFPYNMPDKDFVPRIVATDLAGNERQAGIFYRANHKDFRKRDINLSDNFLQQKAPEFEALVPDPGQPIDIFLYVNREIRQQNRARLAELSKSTSQVPLWQGDFLRQPRASTLAMFGDQRTYYYRGKKIDAEVHLGYDLASVAQDKILASNSGEVVWADYLGIYGQCVVIDHGLGLQTLYGHMSQLDVHQGDQVERGQIIGRSGATGMAGGDHLHFGVFVNGIAVQPLEWWDEHWLKNNITEKLTDQAQ
jgi:murein DD-endopeptidase MepM/ murein hydrolase activator NlpD